MPLRLGSAEPAMVCAPASALRSKYSHHSPALPTNAITNATMVGATLAPAAQPGHVGRLPQAFGDGGLLVGCAYATMQIGRTAFGVWALRGAAQRRNFERILCWCCVSGALAVVGGLAGSGGRDLLWLAAVACELLGSAVGFYVPGLGRSTTLEWDIAGGHLAERCQAFILIALGPNGDHRGPARRQHGP